MNNPEPKRLKTNDEVSSLFSCKDKQCAQIDNKQSNHIFVSRDRCDVNCLYCHKTWTVCVTCKKRFNSRKISLAEKHFEDYHADTHSLRSSVPQRSLNSLGNISFDTFDGDRSNLCNQTQLQEKWLSETTLSRQSQTYFNLRKLSTNRAIHQIVGQAFSQTHDSIQEPSDRESAFHLRLTKFVTNISASMQHDFVYLLNEARQLGFTNTRLPLNINDIAKLYTKNKYAINNQLPSPACYVNEDYAHMNLVQIIEHYIASGYNTENSLVYDQSATTSSVLQYQKVLNIKSNVLRNRIIESDIEPIILFLMIWSDGFDANMYQKNKHSTWIRTVTICSEVKFGVSTQHTYLLTLGFKKTNHDDANIILKKQLQELDGGRIMYSGKHKKFIDVYAKVLVMSADRPERADLTHILGHNGLTTRRWTYTAYIDQDKFSSCKKCLIARFDHILGHKQNIESDRCRHCCNWNYESKSRHIQHPKPKYYPKFKHPSSPPAPYKRDVDTLEYLEPIHQTFDWLKQGCRFCFHNVFHSTWNLSSADEYIRSLGLSQTFGREFVIRKAKKLFEANPNHHDPCSTLIYPPLWEAGMDLNQYIDVPMHLLFLGIIKATIDFTFTWLKAQKKLTAFGQYVHLLHKNIQMVQCEFCKLESFTFNAGNTNTNGWRAESHLAFCRCITYSFGYISQFIDDMYKIEKEAFEHLHHLLLCVISRLMADTQVSVIEIDEYIKLFLSLYDLCEKVTFVEDTSDMEWYKKSNFLCLLNLKEQIERYGPIRNFWEGSRERYIQNIKPYFKHTRETISFLKIQMEKLSKTQVLTSLCQESDIMLKQKTYERYHSLVSYKNIETVLDLIKNENPISVLYEEKTDNMDLVYIPIKHKKQIKLHQINFYDRGGVIIYNAYFAQIRFEAESCYTFDQIQDIDLQKYCPSLCLPRKVDTKVMYSVLAKNWLYRTSFGKFELPKISDNMKTFIQAIM